MTSPAGTPANASGAKGDPVLPDQEKSYTVVSGDTLWGIAKKHNVALEKLLQANPGIKNPNLIHPGDKVVVPR